MARGKEQGIGMKVIEATELFDLGLAGFGGGLIALSSLFPPLAPIAPIGIDFILGGSTSYALKRGNLHKN